MKQKPKGPKYRNLTARGGVIYYEREAVGKRVRLSCKTAYWDEVARARDLLEAQRCRPAPGDRSCARRPSASWQSLVSSNPGRARAMREARVAGGGAPPC